MSTTTKAIMERGRWEDVWKFVGKTEKNNKIFELEIMCKNCGATKTEFVAGREVCVYCGTPISERSIGTNDVSEYLNGFYKNWKDFLLENLCVYDTTSGKTYTYNNDGFSEIQSRLDNCKKKNDELRKGLRKIRNGLRGIGRQCFHRRRYSVSTVF